MSNNIKKQNYSTTGFADIINWFIENQFTGKLLEDINNLQDDLIIILENAQHLVDIAIDDLRQFF